MVIGKVNLNGTRLFSRWSLVGRVNVFIIGRSLSANTIVDSRKLIQAWLIGKEKSVNGDLSSASK